MDLIVNVDDMDEVGGLVHILDETAKAATENGNDDTAEVLAGFANQIRGPI